MGAVGLLAGGELRRRWRSAVLLALLVGLVGAVVLATAAGARRSSTSLTRFDAISRSSDLAYLPAFEYTPTPAQLAAVRAAPGVEAVSVLRFFALRPTSVPKSIPLAVSVDGAEGSVIDRSRLVRGRRADPDAANEVDIDEPLAAQLHLAIGAHIDLSSYTRAQVEGSSPGPPPQPAGPDVSLVVVGLVRRPVDIGANVAQGGAVAQILLTPGFNRAYFNRIGNFGVLLNIRTADGAADGPAVTKALQPIFAKSGGISPQTGTIFDAQGAQKAIDVLTLALWILAGVAAVAGTITIAIVFARDLGRTGVDQATLRALGLTRRERMLASTPRAPGRRWRRAPRRRGRDCAVSAVSDRHRPPRRPRRRPARRLARARCGCRRCRGRRVGDRVRRFAAEHERHRVDRDERDPLPRVGDRRTRSRGRRHR